MTTITKSSPYLLDLENATLNGKFIFNSKTESIVMNGQYYELRKQIILQILNTLNTIQDISKRDNILQDSKLLENFFNSYKALMTNLTSSYMQVSSKIAQMTFQEFKSQIYKSEDASEAKVAPELPKDEVKVPEVTKVKDIEESQDIKAKFVKPVKTVKEV